MSYAGPERRKQPDEVHRTTIHLVEEIHRELYDQLHPEVAKVLDALCGAEDPLTGQRPMAAVPEAGILGALEDLKKPRAPRWLAVILAALIAATGTVAGAVITHQDQTEQAVLDLADDIADEVHRRLEEAP